MYELKYTNVQGKELNFTSNKYEFSDTNEKTNGEENTFSLIGFEGFGDTGADVQTQQSPFQDGSSHINSLLQNKPLYIEFVIRAKNYDDLSDMRRYVNSVFNPKLAGEIELKISDKTYIIKAYPEHLPTYAIGSEDAIGKLQTTAINLLAPNPYWRSPNETTKPLVAYEGGFTLPFTLPFTLGRSGSKTVLYNDGDVPAPMRIEIHGPTTNPQIFNRTTGGHIRINRTVAEGEVMHINTESGRQRITVTDENGNETNAFGYLDSESSILSQFNLELGENEIEHVADAGNRHAEVIVRWDDLYVGV